MSGQPSRKVLVFGVDGADLRVVEPLVAAGELPNFAGLLRRGSFARMETVLPPNSAPAWVSMATGKNPGKHGVYHFTRLGKRTGPHFLTSAASVKSACLWHIVSDAGLRVGVINVPLTYPPSEVNGFFISGLDAPWTSSASSHPKDLMAEIRSKVGNYRHEADLADLWAIETTAQRRRFLAAIEQTERIRKDALLHLMKTRPWDLLFVVFTGVDRVQHRCWKFYDRTHLHHDPAESAEFARAVPDMYRLIDGFLGETLAATPPETAVLLVSDHGGGPAGCRYLDLNRWLAAQGYLRLRDSGARPQAGPVRRPLVAAYLRGRHLFRRFSSPGLRRLMRRAFAPWHEKLTADSMFADVDWPATRLYSDRNVEAVSTLWVNQAGREPFGIVPESQAPELLSEVAARLRSLADPETGEPLAERVFSREELYNGPWSHLGPDLVVRWKCDALRTQHCRSAQQTPDLWIGPVSREETSLTSSGEHGRYGTFIAAGRDVAPVGRLRDVHITDVAPTALALLGLPVPADMDGRPVSEALETGVAAAVRGSQAEPGPQAAARDLTEAEQQAVAERLRNLGYLE